MANFLFVPRFSITNADFTIIDGNGNVADADAQAVTGAYYSYTSGVPLFSRSATRVAEGIYRITLSSAESALPGLYYLKFTYDLSSVAQEYRTDIEVPSSSSPLYESLSDDLRLVVESVWDRFEDLFDSNIGGPHLLMYAQASFGRERVAQLMRVAVGRMNTVSQPHQSYTITDPGAFPVAQWGALLEQATLIEVIKHLMRAYVEQPDAQGLSSARLDRRDYLNRWQTMLTIEEATLDSQMEVFKIANMNLGTPSILVAGGVYGNLVRTTPPARPKHRPPWNY